MECAVSFQEEPAARLQPPEEVKNTARPWDLAQERQAQGNQTSQEWPLSTYVVALNVTRVELTIELCVWCETDTSCVAADTLGVLASCFCVGSLPSVLSGKREVQNPACVEVKPFPRCCVRDPRRPRGLHNGRWE